MDQKMEKFKVLAEKRVQNALKAISLIGALSKRSSYHYTEDHVEQIFSALEQALEGERKKFDLELNGKPGYFKFSLTEESEDPESIPADEAAVETLPSE
ncbi:hypothetical protein [Megasphaera massiliensis]|uniref:hypothetical protein n=1 Tax=Megasphaera massiliensis TaxID=1232428 RepID=UPI00259A738A|nr:hypothetical protein [uncultured Megasphaera sp.]